MFDLIGPVMIGPSSSHTAGAARIGLTARLLLGEDVQEAVIGLHGSFAKTYQGHGTDRAIVGGLMGMAVDDPRLRNSLQLAQEAGIRLTFQTLNLRGAHPNTVRIEALGVHGAQLTLEGASVGGGNIEIQKLNGMKVAFSGKENTLIIHHSDAPGAIARVTSCIAEQNVNIATLQVYRQQAGGDAMMVMELDGELPESTLKTIQKMEGLMRATFLRRRHG